MKGSKRYSISLMCLLASACAGKLDEPVGDDDDAVGDDDDAAGDDDDGDDDDDDATGAYDATGVWAGDCTGEPSSASAGTYTVVGYHIDLQLQDTGGAVDGSVLFTTFAGAGTVTTTGTGYPRAISGTQKGPEVTLGVFYTGSTSNTYSLENGLQFNLTLVGDLMDGRLYSLSDTFDFSVDCSLAR